MQQEYRIYTERITFREDIYHVTIANLIFGPN